MKITSLGKRKSHATRIIGKVEVRNTFEGKNKRNQRSGFILSEPIKRERSKNTEKEDIEDKLIGKRKKKEDTNKEDIHKRESKDKRLGSRKK
jgi:hypothetical protein